MSLDVLTNPSVSLWASSQKLVYPRTFQCPFLQCCTLASNTSSGDSHKALPQMVKLSWALTPLLMERLCFQPRRMIQDGSWSGLQRGQAAGQTCPGKVALLKQALLFCLLSAGLGNNREQPRGGRGADWTADPTLLHTSKGHHAALL